MRAFTLTTLTLGAALASATAAAPALALDRYEDGTRLDGAGLARSQSGSVATRATTDGKGARLEPAEVVAPCPSTGGGGTGGMYLNGVRFNGWHLNGIKLQGRGAAGRSDAAGTGALRVTAVRLPDGRALSVRQR